MLPTDWVVIYYNVFIIEVIAMWWEWRSTPVKKTTTTIIINSRVMKENRPTKHKIISLWRESVCCCDLSSSFTLKSMMCVKYSRLINGNFILDHSSSLWVCIKPNSFPVMKSTHKRLCFQCFFFFKHNTIFTHPIFNELQKQARIHTCTNTYFIW